MRAELPAQFLKPFESVSPVDVTIVMPCLDESRCLGACLANAFEALAMIEHAFGLTGEVVVADNGSTDGSQAIAAAAGARVVPVQRRGYGAALIGGAEAAFGRYILMGDADGSYDFREGVAMVGKLVEGADLCMGSRFKGGIAPGAMPWKNRYIGNPALTGILNLFYRARVSDAHCGLRAITSDAFRSLRLCGSGMEFASEMVIKAALRRLKITEVPATLSKDLRDRAPHLRPWRDGWRHLRYLMMLSPTWVFAVPAAIAATLAMIIFLGALLGHAGAIEPVFGDSWSVLGGALLGLAHLAALMAMATHIHGVRSGYRLPIGRFRGAAKLLNLETMLVTGLGATATGIAALAACAAYWSAGGFAPLGSALPMAASAAILVIGIQNVLGGFMLAIIGGNEASFLQDGSEELDLSLALQLDHLMERAA